MVSSEISAGKAMGTPRPPVMMLKAGRLGGWDQDLGSAHIMCKVALGELGGCKWM